MKAPLSLEHSYRVTSKNSESSTTPQSEIQISHKELCWCAEKCKPGFIKLAACNPFHKISSFGVKATLQAVSVSAHLLLPYRSGCGQTTGNPLWEHHHKCKTALPAQYSGGQSPHLCNIPFLPANRTQAAHRLPGISRSSAQWRTMRAPSECAPLATTLSSCRFSSPSVFVLLLVHRGT
jgi:hypothetical protein